MSEKNIILNQWRNRHSVMPPQQAESTNPVIRFLTHYLELLSKLFSKWVTP